MYFKSHDSLNYLNTLHYLLKNKNCTKIQLHQYDWHDSIWTLYFD